MLELDKFSNGLEHLETRLEPRSPKFSRIDDQESSFEYRALRDCQLTFEWYCTMLSEACYPCYLLFLNV